MQFVTHVIESGSYGGVVLLMGIESACIPLPSEIIMPFAGYVVYQGHMNLWWVATAGALGCNAGSVVAYWIGAKGGRPLVERYGKWVLMSHHDLDRMTYFFDKYGSVTVLLGRLLSPLCAPSSRFPWSLWDATNCASTSILSLARGRGASAFCRHGESLAKAGTIRIRRFTRCSIAFIPSSLRSCSSARCGSSGPT